MNTRLGLASLRDKSPISTISEGAPGALRRLNNRLGRDPSCSAVCAGVVMCASTVQPLSYSSRPLPEILLSTKPEHDGSACRSSIWRVVAGGGRGQSGHDVEGAREEYHTSRKPEPAGAQKPEHTNFGCGEAGGRARGLDAVCITDIGRGGTSGRGKTSVFGTVRDCRCAKCEMCCG